MGSNTEKKPWTKYKTHTKIEAKRLRATNFAIAKTKNKAQKIKSIKSTKSNREKFNIIILPSQY